jgi:hypothetical protein
MLVGRPWPLKVDEGGKMDNGLNSRVELCVSRKKGKGIEDRGRMCEKGEKDCFKGHDGQGNCSDLPLLLRQVEKFICTVDGGEC